MSSHPVLPSKVKADLEEFKDWLIKRPCSDPLNLLITGKTGVGKSRLVNALIGKGVAKEGKEKDPCTSKVTSYQAVIEGVQVTVWDSPGLQDGTGHEDQYIQDMKDKIQDIALMTYCVRMDDTRFYEADKKAIQTLTDEFGEEVWNHAVVALTFANKVEDPDGNNDLPYFESQLEIWKEQFNKYFASVGINPKTCSSIPVIPVGNKKGVLMRLPDRENWLTDLWIESFQVMKASARRAMYRINRHRLKPKSASSTKAPAPAHKSDDVIPREIPLNEEQEKKLWTSLWESFKTACSMVEDLDEEDELGYFQSKLKEWKKQFNKHFSTVGVNPKTCS